MIKCLTAAAVLVVGSAATAAETAPRQPTKGWVLDYGETSCTAVREYGTLADPLSLILRPSPFGNVMQLIVFRAGHGEVAEHMPVVVTLPNGPLKTTGLRYWDKNGHQILLISFPRAAVDQIKEASSVGIRAGGIIDENFALPAINRVVQGLDTCDADLRQHWNVADNGTPQTKTPARPLMPLARYVSDGDYPEQAVEEGGTGISKVTLMIDETGVLKDCLVEETSGIASLDAMACVVFMRRAKFHPALDAAGKPMRSILSTRIRWVMADDSQTTVRR
jgi:hypothetical protein